MSAAVPGAGMGPLRDPYVRGVDADIADALAERVDCGEDGGPVFARTPDEQPGPVDFRGDDRASHEVARQGRGVAHRSVDQRSAAAADVIEEGRARDASVGDAYHAGPGAPGQFLGVGVPG